MVKNGSKSFRTKIRKADSLLELCKTFLTEKQRVGLLAYGSFINNKLNPAISASYYIEVKKWLSATVTYSAYNRSWFNMGFGYSINLGPIQWYLVTDNFMAAIDPDKHRNMNLRFGVNWNFGRNDKKDKSDASFQF